MKRGIKFYEEKEQRKVRRWNRKNKDWQTALSDWRRFKNKKDKIDDKDNYDDC